MPHRPYPPAYLRYLQARLSIFRQSAFWGISLFLLSIGIISWEYWLKSDHISQQQNSKVIPEQPVIQSDSTMSDEDKSIAADIDNLPVLLNDFQQAALSATLVNSQAIDFPQENNNFLEDAIKKNNENNQSKNINYMANNITPTMDKNPFVTQSENLLQLRRNDRVSQFSGNNTLTKLPEITTSTTNSGNDPTSNNDSSVLMNPLETAIKQSSNYNNGVNTSIPLTNSLPNQVSVPSNSMGYIQPTITNQQSNLYPNINNVPTSQPGGVPNQVSRSSNSMGYIQPTITNQQSNLYPNINSVPTSQPGGVPVLNVSPVSSTIPNNTYPIQSTNPGKYGNYSGDAIQPPTQSTPSNLAYPGQVQGQYPSGYRN